MSLENSRVHRSSRQLIVVTRPAVELTAAASPSQLGIADVVSAAGASLRPISPVSVAAAGKAPAAVGGPVEKLGRYHQVVADDAQLETLRDTLSRHKDVEAAYIKPAGQPPSLRALRQPEVLQPGSTTPDFTGRQGYLAPAPAGVDALFAWRTQGGRGAGVNIIDCEWDWNFAHEDLATHCGGAVVGSPPGDDDNHGTAVIGEIIGNANGFGVTGIAPDAMLSTACFDDSNQKATSTIILEAAERLSAGDVMLLEIHRPGPHTPTPENGQLGYIPIEWWPDDFQAIAHATGKGIIVVEAGGNGSENLDDPLYSTPGAGFPPDWRNPFAAGGADSGAILVGAGNPPTGTHGRSMDTIGFGEIYVDRARCVYSNYGRRVDCQGWGWEVTSLGYGDLQPGAGVGVQPTDHNRLYTDTFSGTSSASPIVTGVVACVQGALRASGRALLTPVQMRNLLRTTGSTQQSAPGRPVTQRIGNRPDLRALLQELVQTGAPTAVGAAAVPVQAVQGSGKRYAGTILASFAAVAMVVLTLSILTSLAQGTWLSRGPFWAWLIDLALILGVIVGLGLQWEGSALGAAVDWRNKLSLSRLQIIAWTTLFVPTLFVALVWDTFHQTSLVIPSTVWLLMGLSGVSAVGTPLILSQKPDTVPAGAPLPPAGLVADGVVVSRPEGAPTAWADLLLGDEVGNATSIDIGKLQQVLLTAVALITYGCAIGELLFGTAVTDGIAKLPEMSEGFLALIAASHGTYLAFKAVPHT